MPLHSIERISPPPTARSFGVGGLIPDEARGNFGFVTSFLMHAHWKEVRLYLVQSIINSVNINSTRYEFCPNSHFISMNFVQAATAAVLHNRVGQGSVILYWYSRNIAINSTSTWEHSRILQQYE